MNLPTEVFDDGSAAVAMPESGWVTCSAPNVADELSTLQRCVQFLRFVRCHANAGPLVITLTGLSYTRCSPLSHSMTIDAPVRSWTTAWNGNSAFPTILSS